MRTGFLPSLLARIRSSVRYHAPTARALGLRGWLTWQWNARSRRLARLSGYRLRSKDARYAMKYRPGESDLTVFRQIFIEREYSCLDHYVCPDGGLVVDCGANVGYSSAYFLSRFPTARVVAVEPDRDNFRMLEENTRPFGNRVSLLNTGVWSHACGLVFGQKPFRDGMAWAVQVREARPGETAELEAVDIPTILRMTGAARIALLKVDIERAELALFGPGCREWVSRCDAIVIELHDEECERTFFAAIDGEGFEVSRCGELTVCLRPTPTPADASRRLATTC
jgi:FkbM family methyltransferase